MRLIYILILYLGLLMISLMKYCSRSQLHMTMKYEFMRLILFFDLPVMTPKQRHTYNVFRKYLIKNGYMMMQFSVYCKIFANREAAVKHVNILKKNVPKEGQIRILVVTEKQYAKIEIIVGGKSLQEATVNAESFIEL